MAEGSVGLTVAGRVQGEDAGVRGNRAATQQWMPLTPHPFSSQYLEGLPPNPPPQARGFSLPLIQGRLGLFFFLSPNFPFSSPRIIERKFAQDAQTLSGSSTCLAKVVALGKGVWSS